MADLSLSVILGASMANGFNGLFGKASKSVGDLGKAMKATHIQLNQVQAYQRNESALDATRAKLGETVASVRGLKRAIAAGDTTPKLATQLKTAEGSAVKLSATLEAQRGKLRQEGDALRRAGIDTKDLSSANERLTRTFEKQKGALAANYRVMEKRKALRGQLLGQTPKLLAAAVFGRKAIASAVDFESAMADVRKAVNFSSPKGLNQMGQAITALSLKLPMARDDIAEIMASGGMSGIAKNELLGFAADATKMGVAFDIAAQDAGDQMAKWRTAFQLNQPQVVALADKINYLDNSTAASAAQISLVVSKIGALGGVAGLSSGDIAALGATTIGMGIDQDIAATGIKNLMLSMTAGAAATPKQAKAFKLLGIDAKQLAEHMQTDAGGAIIGLLEKIKQLPKAAQAATLTQLFGRESVGAIAPLLSNLDELKKNLQAVGDATKYSGSMQKEFLSRASTTANALQLGKNAWTALTGAIGKVFLPTIKVVVGKFITLAQVVVNFSSKFPHLTAVLVGAAGALVTFNTAMIGLKLLGTVANVKTLSGAVRLLVPGFGLAAKGLMLLGGAFRAVGIAMMTTPLGWVIAGIAAVAVGAYFVIKYWKPIKNFFIDIWQSIGDVVAVTWGGIKAGGEAAARALGAIWDAYAGVYVSIWNGIKIGAVAVWNFIGKIGSGAADAMSGAWNGAISFVGGLWDALKVKVAAVVNWVTTKIEWVANKWKTIKGLPGAVWGDIKQAGASIGSTIAGPAMATAGGPGFKMPPMATRGNVTQNYQGGPTTLTINAAPGMDERALAKHVRQQLDERDRQQAARRRSALSDLD